MQAGLQEGSAGECVATLSYVYDHHSRDLPRRLTETHHARHDLQVATLHVHLDRETCLEVAVLRGDPAAVQGLANTITAERGVAHGALSIIPVAARDTPHAPEAGHRGLHRSIRPGASEEETR